MAKKFSKPELSRRINGDLPMPATAEEAAEAKTRLDLAVYEKYPSFSRATIQKFIKNRQVTVDGSIIDKPNTLITEGAQLELQLASPRLSAPKPQVIFENDDVIVLDKPAGMLTVSKGAFNPEHTLEDYGLVVHRLDRDTSGVIILAKNAAAKTYLQKQFHDRKAHKTYYAVVVGRPKIPHAVIDIPITRNLKRPTTFMVTKTGRSAITEYREIAHNQRYSLLELKPRTGRTHQLRVHLAHLGTPILGDKVYNPQSSADRMYLHANILEITIPGGERLTFTAALPESFRNVVQ